MNSPLTAKALRFQDGNDNILNQGGQNEHFKLCFLLLRKMLSKNYFFCYTCLCPDYTLLCCMLIYFTTLYSQQHSVGQGREGQGKAEYSRVGQSRVGQGRVGQGRVEQGTVGQGRVGQGRVGQSRLGQGRVGQPRVEQSRVELSRVEKSRVELS